MCPNKTLLTKTGVRLDLTHGLSLLNDQSILTVTQGENPPTHGWGKTNKGER